MRTLKVVIVVMAVACIMSTLTVPMAQAAGPDPGWATVWVNRTGQAWDTKYAICTDATGTMPLINATYFTISLEYDGNAILASALTAMASGMKVQIYVTDRATSSVIMAMFLTDK